MVVVEEAFRIIQSVGVKLAIEEVDIIDATGRILAEAIRADRDFPPFNRVAMDGIAIMAERFNAKGQEFLIEDVQAAGSAPLILNNQNNCIEVMTGSVLPTNTNAVVRYEDLELKENKAKILIEKIEVGSNVHKQGKDAAMREVLLISGQRISSAEIALLASIGKKSVHVFAFPKTAVVSSGDELVEIDEIPLSHQIRKSNSYALQAAMREIGWESESFHLLDDKALIKKNLQTILENDDVLILSGGVSKGKFDFIPQALEELGIQKLFHQVSQRPGKPFWFGASPDRSKIVFALPGNPVSTFLCFYKYIKPWIMNSMGATIKPSMARLAADVNFSPSLTYFLQVSTEIKDGVLVAHPNMGGGSGDFANLKNVDGFLELPLEKSSFKAGEVYPYIPFRQ
jgi:molybdopterin molybdotransferase